MTNYDNYIKKITKKYEPLPSCGNKKHKSGLEYKLNNIASDDRNSIFRDFGSDISSVERNARHNIPVLNYQSFDSRFARLESAIARITDNEARDRPKYNMRCVELVEFAYNQLEKSLRDNCQIPKVSIGVKELLKTSIDYVGGLSTKQLEDYYNKGCDINGALFADNLSFYGMLSGNNAIRGAKSYCDLICSGNLLVQMSDGFVSYNSELAVRVVRAFVSIAEYERFKSNVKTKDNDLKSMYGQVLKDKYSDISPQKDKLKERIDLRDIYLDREQRLMK
jgi:hypothetical protein